MTHEPKWEFIPNDARQIHGWNDAGVETFRGTQITSLTREVIQNSIDAVSDDRLPVRVKFSLMKDVDFGQSQLASIFNNCWESSRDFESERALEFFRRGAPELEMNAQIQTLVIEDFNTTGLSENRWEMLLTAEGVGAKPRPDSLGSYGIGKKATFAASRYRTVLYSTQFAMPTCIARKFQGKSILVSHRDDDGKPKGSIGYFGADEWNVLEEIDGESGTIPDAFRRYADGTSIYVVGFDSVEGWRREIISSVLSNFFYAILNNKLVVDVDGATDDGLPERIEKDSMAAAFDVLVAETGASQSIVDAKALFETIAVVFPETSSIRQATTDGQLQQLGHTKIWIRVGEGLPNQALIIRDPGMAICDAVRRFPYLKRLPGNWGDFAAVVVCADEEGNDLLRSMEPPAHDNFEPDRLKGVGDESAASRGERALSELGRRIREWVDHEMPDLEVDEVAPLDDLSDFFPSEGLNTETNVTGEETDPFGPSIVGSAATKLPIVRRPTTPSYSGDEDVRSNDDDGEDERVSERTSSGGGGTGNPNQNRGPGNSTRGPRATISGVRMNRENGRFLVSFTPDEDFVGRLSIAIASEEKRSEDNVKVVRLIDQDGREFENNTFEGQRGKRMRFAVHTEMPLPDGHAVIVEAVKEVSP